MKAMKLPLSPTNQISTHNKQSQLHQQASTPPVDKPSIQNSSSKPETHTESMPKTLAQSLNTTVRTPTTPNSPKALTQRIETSITTITKLSDSDMNRLGTFLPKEQLASLTKTNSTNHRTNTGVDLLTLKIPNSQESLNAIAKSGWKIGTKVHIELPIIAPPKLLILEEKRFQSAPTSSTPSNTNKNMVNTEILTSKHNPTDTLTHKADTQLTRMTRKALVDIGLRKYLPQQIDKSLTGKLIDQLTSSKHPLTQTNQDIHSVQLKQATVDVIKSLSHLEKISINPLQTVTSAELKSAIKNSGMFFESQIKGNIQHVTEKIHSGPEAPASPKVSATSTSPPLKSNGKNAVLNTSMNNKAHEISPLNEHLKHHDVKAILLNLIATITMLQNTSNAQVTQPKLNLTGFDKLLKTLISPGESTKEINIKQQQVLENIKTLANNVLNRISTNQLLSLSQNQSDHAAQTFVNLDIPLKVGDQCLPLHMQIEERVSEQNSHDGNKSKPGEGKNDKKSLKSSWHVILEFSFLKQGDFYSTVNIYGDVLKSTLWAENPNIQQELDICLPKLETQLTAQGIVVEELRTVKNKPVGSTNQIKHHLVDVKT